MMHVFRSPAGRRPLVLAMKLYQHTLLLQGLHTHVISIIADVKKETGEARFIMTMNDSRDWTFRGACR